MSARLGPMMDGELPGGERRAVLLHVAGCLRCQADRDRLERLGTAARELPGAPLDARLAERVRRRAEGGPFPIGRALRFAAAAGLLVAAAAGAYLLGRAHGGAAHLDPRPLRPGTVPLYPTGGAAVVEAEPDWLPPLESSAPDQGERALHPWPTTSAEVLPASAVQVPAAGR